MKMYQNELSFKNHESALIVAEKLLNEHYVVMLSREENLIILNYEYSHNSDRNDMMFMRRDEFEDEWFSSEE